MAATCPALTATAKWYRAGSFAIASAKAITLGGSPQMWTGKMIPIASARLTTGAPEHRVIGMTSASPNSFASNLAVQRELPVPV